MTMVNVRNSMEDDEPAIRQLHEAAFGPEEGGLTAHYPIPEKNADAWMVLETRPGMLGRVRGTIRCAEALDAPEHRRE